MDVRQWIHFITVIIVVFSAALTKELVSMCQHAQTQLSLVRHTPKSDLHCTPTHQLDFSENHSAMLQLLCKDHSLTHFHYCLLPGTHF